MPDFDGWVVGLARSFLRPALVKGRGDMPSSSIVTSSDVKLSELDPALSRIADRAYAAGFKVQVMRWRNPATKDLEGAPELKVDFPAGRVKREVQISSGDAGKWANVDFAQWVFLGDYDAILDRSSGRIVAELHHRADGFGLRWQQVPGTEEIPEDDPDLVPLDEWEADFVTRNPIRIRIEHKAVEGVSIVVQKPPPVPLRIACRSRNSWGLVLTGVTTDRHDEALRLLQEVSTSLFVDLDMSYGNAFLLKKDVRVEWAHDRGDDELPSQTKPRFPVLAHNDDAASLYLYARTLVRVPLLEYLAYYQVLEHFMPKYARLASVQKLRNVLKDPRFNHDDDLALGRVIEMLADSGRTSGTEREQLRATIVHCLDPTALAGYFELHPRGEKALADKTRIAAVRLLNPKDTSVTPVEQVADRIYDLRCRIVHGKDGGGGRGEPLRPFGPESKLLAHDVALIRFVAQRVLISSSGPATWWR
ncbi:hypothetical protein VA596_33950 [Amycolatopsis sp., V23-08]|uniref:Apea-like HEPN domain-containing protein n=1 Tax=Amycolatopsis heterodermiae TaxID=3110235 RepID=A0ABU5RE67_9PSEU|nr:hypothetical protein [Amycolatopsis sp., V23-08]MEA5364576.1 hypothetical protein [Amycolatopsis sp., V23-08]